MKILLVAKNLMSVKGVEAKLGEEFKVLTPHSPLTGSRFSKIIILHGVHEYYMQCKTKQAVYDEWRKHLPKHLLPGGEIIEV